MKGFTKKEKEAFNKKADKFKKTIDECNTYGTLIYVDFTNKSLVRVDESQEYLQEKANMEELAKESF